MTLTTSPAPTTAAFPAAQWPIAAAMLQFPRRLGDGTIVDDAEPPIWQRLLQPIVDAGFTALEVPSAWIRLGDLAPDRLTSFSSTVHEMNLQVVGATVVRESVIHPTNWRQNLDFSHRTIDAAAAMGVPIVCLGLHDALLPAQQRALWFWTEPGTQMSPDPAVREHAVSRYRELAEHAGTVDVQLSLELYEDTYLGTGVGAVQFLHDIDHPAVSLNPDIGNLIRRQGPIEAWEDIVELTAPHANYWHVKNILRLENPAHGIVLTHPAPLESGIINYRAAVAHAISHGFAGAFVVEHYGGDGLSVGATNRDYLRRILPQ